MTSRQPGVVSALELSLAALAIALLPACTSLTPGGRQVRLVDRPAAVRSCRFLGKVTGRARSTKPGSPLTGNFAIARENARTEVRNRAARAGADTLLRLTTRDDFFGVDAWAYAFVCRGR
jgi:hypothetical protein